MGKVDKIIFKSYEVMDKGCHFFYEIDGEETKLYLNHSTSYILNFQQQETIFLNIGMCYLLDLAELLIPNYVEINFYMSSDQLKYWSSLYKEVSKEKCCIEKINLEELEKTQWSIHGKKNDSNLIVLDSSIKKTMLCLTGGKESLTLLKLLKGKKDLHLFFWNLETCVHRSKAYERVKKDLPTTKSLSNRNEVIKKLGLKYKTSLGSGVDMAHLVFNALLFSPEYVLIGNEYSSNFPNKMYQGSMINHQYVKTIEFART